MLVPEYCCWVGVDVHTVERSPPLPLPESIELNCCVVALGAQAKKNSELLQPHYLNLNDMLMYSTGVDILTCMVAQPVHETTTTLPWAMKIEADSIFLKGQKQRPNNWTFFVSSQPFVNPDISTEGCPFVHSPDTEWLSRVFLWRPVIFRRHFSEKACESKDLLVRRLFRVTEKSRLVPVMEKQLVWNRTHLVSPPPHLIMCVHIYGA